MGEAVLDRWGSPVFTDHPRALVPFNEAVEDLVSLSGDPLERVEAALATDSRLILGQVLQAYLELYSTSAAGFERARKVLRELDPWDLAAGERELLHLRAAHAWAGGEWERAVAFLERALLHDPGDLLALKVAQDLHFFLGNPSGLRGVVERVLSTWVPGRPGWGYVQGMYAFGLEENGEYAGAEQQARDALGQNAGDVWAVHALAHVFEMTGDQGRGIAFLTRSADDWSGSYFAVHNWWHRALYHLELGEIDEVLALYDGPIRGTRSNEWLDVVDAASLLWRLRLFGIDVGNRADQLASDVEAILDDPVYVFNDWHAVMVAGLAGRREVVEHLVSVNRRGTAGTNRRSVEEAGLDLLEGFSAFARGDAEGAVDRLADIRPRAHVVGGSHAQRDVIDLTLLAAAAGAGKASLAQVLVDERVAQKPAASAAAERVVVANRRR